MGLTTDPKGMEMREPDWDIVLNALAYAARISGDDSMGYDTHVEILHRWLAQRPQPATGGVLPKEDGPMFLHGVRHGRQQGLNEAIELIRAAVTEEALAVAGKAGVG